VKNVIYNLQNLLIQKGIRPSHQRIQILEYLMLNRNHPTVEMIYSFLHPHIPTLSKTTVYNTLNLLLDHGLVRELSIDDNEARYDIDIVDHGHFKCTTCNDIFDFDINADHLFHKHLDNFIINEKNVFLKGLCPNCNK